MTVIDSDFIKQVGERLYALRSKKGLSIDELVSELLSKAKASVNERTIRRYEKGESLPKIDNLIVLSEYFGVTLDYLIFGRETSDDNSYSWESTFKRINRLLFSCVLLANKNEDQNSPFYGKYFFTNYDDEVSVYLDRVTSFAKSKDYAFITRGRKLDFSVKDLDQLIGDFRESNEVLSPSRERLESVLINARLDPEKFKNEKMAEIVKKRKK